MIKRVRQVQREKVKDVRDSRDWIGLKKPTLLTSTGLWGKQTASMTGFILHNHDPDSQRGRDYFYFDPLLSLAPELSTSG